MRRWDGLVDKHAAALVARGISQAAIDCRVIELNRFGLWLKARRPRVALDQVDADTIVRYVRSRSPFHSKATVAGVVSQVRCMGEFLVEEGIWRSNPLRWMRGPKLDARRRIPRRIGGVEQKAIWEAAYRCRQEHARYQAVCMLAVLYGTGLRRGELERLNVADWHPAEGILNIDGQKTGRARRVPVGEGVWRCIEAYLPHRQNRLELTGRLQETALLINTQGKRMRAEGMSRLVRRLCRNAGLERITMHQFRHSCASDLIEAGVTLPDVQKMLGHAAIETTVRYLAVADPARAQAMLRHPINGFLDAGAQHKEAS